MDPCVVLRGTKDSFTSPQHSETVFQSFIITGHRTSACVGHQWNLHIFPLRRLFGQFLRMLCGNLAGGGKRLFRSELNVDR